MNKDWILVIYLCVSFLLVYGVLLFERYTIIKKMTIVLSDTKISKKQKMELQGKNVSFVSIKNVYLEEIVQLKKMIKRYRWAKIVILGNSSQAIVLRNICEGEKIPFFTDLE